jgi:hypothetical protein
LHEAASINVIRRRHIKSGGGKPAFLTFEAARVESFKLTDLQVGKRGLPPPL